MSRWKLYDNWYADLAGLAVEQPRERRAFAAERAEGAVVGGTGRNPKAGGSGGSGFVLSMTNF
ncbi:hypothetical protein OG250_14975 [Streptomyces sp. NBC_00487]|uniref:hypothetical protein n=1 Tax=unclassified Streptomyces TaxID=2593676 RepID=UPI002DD8244B|nr:MULTISPECIES: hypothetical protein [unclassified Streptomyces]WRY96051.1 hypothetical protein OG889_15685 [Streptomyces sp. NBC_00481]